MSSAIEETVKALVEFESQLDEAKANVSDAKRRTTKDAADWVDAAKTSAVLKAQVVASRRVAEAIKDAEAEANKIREKGESDLKSFGSSISRQRAKAAELVIAALLGENK